MRSLLTTIVCLLSLCASAQLDISNPFFIAGVLGFPPAPPGPGGVLQSTESFEGTTSPWLCGDLAWAINDHSLRGFTNTTIWSHDGSKALWITNSTSFSYLTNQITAQDTNCLSFKWIIHASESGNLKFTLSRLAGGDDFTISPKFGFIWTVNHGSDSFDSAVSWTVGRTNRIWVEWVRDTDGGSASGLLNIWISETSDTFPGGAAHIARTAGAGVDQPTVRTWQCNSADSAFADYLRMWDSRPTNWDF